MAGYVIGMGVLAFMVWQRWSHRVPEGGVEFSGTVVEELSKRSTQPGRRTLVYAPRVEYRHPMTGADEVYEPSAFGQHRFTVGHQTPLIYDQARDRVFRPLDRPTRDTLALTFVGVGLIVAQYLDR